MNAEMNVAAPAHAHPPSPRRSRGSRMLTWLTLPMLLGAWSNRASFDTTKNEVHYEAVDADGAFLQHLILTDPQRGSYERGVWQASRHSAVARLGGERGWMEITRANDNRVNIGFVGDGYTAAEISTYAGDVARIIQRLKTQEPFTTYNNYFNFHRIDVISVDSGVSQDPKGKERNTALGMSYFCSGIARLLCGNLNKIVAEAQNAGPVDAIFAMANSASYGGAGYMDPPVATFGARNPGSLELALHEFGHAFGFLSDEYDSAGTTAPCSSYANIATINLAQMQARKSKWYRWLGVSGIGAFEGACYHARGMYRPTDNSKMRTLNRPFGEVNVEQFILHIYQKVRPIDSSTPAGTYTAHRLFTLDPMRPLDHRLSVVWAVDGIHRAALDGALTVNSAQLGISAGTHVLSATVRDTTALVRDEEARAKWLTQEIHWTLNL